ncbi:hypothetical protein C489_00881 [Natrinema versiforme JCM 10478]|uniref:Uncharacterized protein n=1 Tax=Natrinema versiforme JCM 10478 TaxID=1227496 RepID=L9YD65_9EURY|nr:hypothetical protein C489_00881 [Natrinema versiforme JCM 10478]
MTAGEPRFVDRLRSLLGAPIIALVLVYVDSSLVDLSLFHMATIALVLSVGIHEIAPRVGEIS